MTKMRFRPRAFLTSGLANAGYNAALLSDKQVKLYGGMKFYLVRLNFTIMDN
jgi:hypothetical protein